MSDVVRVSRGRKAWANEAVIEHSSVGNNRARFATGFIEKFGCVACVPDGEDSSGKQAFRLATPSEMVDRACETAQRLYAEFEFRGWLTEVPEAVVDDSEDEQA